MATPRPPVEDDRADDGPPYGGPTPSAPLTVSAVARRLGIAPATLRTWDRRYGLGPTRHDVGSRRRYQAADVARLDVMRRLTRAGVSPADAAHAALTGPADVTSAAPPTGPASRAGGGRVVALADAGEHARGLARAAMALDAGTVADTVGRSLDEHGVVRTWDELVAPVLIGIGTRWEATGEGVDVEHLLSECVLGAMHGATARHRPTTGRAVLLAGAEEEAHALALHALAAGLAERGVPSRLLGARVPRDALAAAYRRLGPPALFVWSQLPPTGDPAQLLELPAVRPRPALVVGGPGWPDRLPAGVSRVTSLAGAVDVLAAAAA